VACLAGRIARAIHDCPAGEATPPGRAVLGRHDVHAEATATLRAGEHIRALLPSVGRTYGLLVSVVLDELGRLPAERATLIHGDLKADNLLVDGGQVRVLDVDRARWAEPALDLGKFLADLRWWSPSARAAALEAAFRDGYGSCDPRRWARAELLASLLQLKLAARRPVLHDGRWQLLVRGRVVGAVESFARTRTR
jgi:aminoglycoside phosphotransferase (APT) family kinase protein